MERALGERGAGEDLMEVRWVTELLGELEYPAWIEKEGVAIFCNELRGAYRELRLNACEWMARNTSVVSDRVCLWQGVSVCRYALGVAGWRRGASLSLCVGSWPGEETERDRQVIRHLLRKLAARCAPADEALGELTRQQRTIYKLLQEKCSYKEIASILGVAHSTVRVQVATLRKVLGDNRVPLLRRTTNKPI